ncbi:unnamed protein product [Lupinus luteus]|uniref:Transmembrane protein n=1 Tax=Lupinus luteus TaxID=3873 RepID=A0AAV1WKH0_LUPLU
MAFSYIKIIFIVPQLLLIFLIIFASSPQYVADCRPLLLNHDQSTAYEVHLQALPRGSAPWSHSAGQSDNHGHIPSVNS